MSSEGSLVEKVAFSNTTRFRCPDLSIRRRRGRGLASDCGRSQLLYFVAQYVTAFDITVAIGPFQSPHVNVHSAALIYFAYSIQSGVAHGIMVREEGSCVEERTNS